MKSINLLLYLFACLFSVNDSYGQEYYPGIAPGKAEVMNSKNIVSLQNNVVKMDFQISGNRLHPKNFIDKSNGDLMNLLPFNCFFLTMKNGKIISDQDFNLQVPLQ